jgi:hypothetical protein
MNARQIERLVKSTPHAELDRCLDAAEERQDTAFQDARTQGMSFDSACEYAADESGLTLHIELNRGRGNSPAMSQSTIRTFQLFAGNGRVTRASES